MAFAVKNDNSKRTADNGSSYKFGNSNSGGYRSSYSYNSSNYNSGDIKDRKMINLFVPIVIFMVTPLRNVFMATHLVSSQDQEILV